MENVFDQARTQLINTVANIIDINKNTLIEIDLTKLSVTTEEGK